MLGCAEHQPAKLVLPCKSDEIDGKDKIFFKNFKNQVQKPYIMIGDGEAYTTKTETGMKGAYQDHQASAFGYVTIDRSTEESKKPELKIFDGVSNFLKAVIKDAKHYCKMMKESCQEKKVPIKMSPKDQHNHCQATECYLCKKPLKLNTESEYNAIKLLTKRHKTYQAYVNYNQKVKDHCHLTGRYRGAAHSKCNLKCRNDRFDVDFFLHNGKNYDFHFIINAAAELSKEINLDISCIPLNTGKIYIFYS
jgi:hypothetical protein